MQPNQGILEDQTLRLFHQGEWDELERLYLSLLHRDRSDPRTTLRLANLRAYRERYSKSLELYDAVRAHHGLEALALNNLGVALSCLGETGAAFQALSDAVKNDGGYAPSFYNLGILCEKLGDEGTLPEVVLNLGLGPRDARPGALAPACYEKALKLSWPVTDPQDRPLLLWVGDLKPGFGFEMDREIANVSEAHSLYNEGMGLLAQGRWRDAVSKLEGAADLHPEAFRVRIKAPRTAALVEIIREHRAEVRRRWQEGDYDGAAQTIDELLGLSADLPDREFADEILEAGIQDLARQIRSHKPENGWESLQRLVTAARQRVEEPEDVAEEGEAAPSPGPSAAGDGQEPADRTAAAQTPTSAGGKSEAPRWERSRRYIQRVCRSAWSQQIKHMIKTGGVDEAIQLLEFSQVQWFAQEDVAEWRRSAYTAKAEILRAQGQDAQDNENLSRAAERWLEGRAAALRAADPLLTDNFDTLLDNLAAALPKEDRARIERERRAADQKELERVTKQLEGDPGNPRLSSHRDVLIRQRLSQAKGALAARLWERAKDIADEILTAVPEEPEALEFSLAADRGRAEQRLQLAEASLERGQYEEAEKLCQEALVLDPDHARVRELLREAQAARSRRENPSESPYDTAFHSFCGRQDAVDPEGAHHFLLTLRKLEPQSEQTREALDWYSTSLVHFLRSELEAGPHPAAAEEEDSLSATDENSPDREDPPEAFVRGLEARLAPLLRLRPDFRPALALREELRRAAKPHAEEKRKLSLRKLEEANKALLAGKPAQALEALREVEKLRDPNLQAEVRERQAEAIDLLADQIADLLRNGKEENLVKVETLLNIYEFSAPDAARAVREEIGRRRQERVVESEIERQLKELVELVKKHQQTPFRALREIDRQVRAIELGGSEIRIRKQAELRALRRRVRSAMTPPVRGLAWLYDRYYATDRLRPDEAPAGQEGKKE